MVYALNLSTYVAPTPIITFHPPSPIQNMMVGDQLTIECRVNTALGVNSVSISWTGPGGPIMNNARVTISPTTRNGNVFTSSLSFAYLMEEGDDGNYTCNVMILETSESQSVELQIPSMGKLW